MSIHRELRVVLDSVLAGGVSDVLELKRFTHNEIQDAARSVHLLVRARALETAVQSWRNGDVSDDAINQWASFIRRGYLTGVPPGPIVPLKIAYEQKCEDAMVEVIARLDELGELIDGTVSQEEKEEMLRHLDASSR